MHRLLSVLVMLLAVSFSAGTLMAADPMKEKEASPTLGERITKDAIKGTLMKKTGEFYTIKDNDGMGTRCMWTRAPSSTLWQKAIRSKPT